MALTLEDTINLILTRQVNHKIQSIQPDFLLRPEIPSHITSLTGYTHTTELIAFGKKVTQPILADLLLSLHPTNDPT